MLDRVFNLQPSQLFELKNAYFPSEKQNSEVPYQQVENEILNKKVVSFKNIDSDSRMLQKIANFEGYYDLFVASQVLQRSVILKDCNLKMHMKMYA